MGLFNDDNFDRHFDRFERKQDKIFKFAAAVGVLSVVLGLALGVGFLYLIYLAIQHLS